MAASWEWWLAGGILVWLLLGGWAAAHAIMFKRDPRSSAIWVLLSFLFPIAGPWLYWAIGVNRIERRALRHLGRRDLPFSLTASWPSAASPDTTAPCDSLYSLRSVADRVTRMPLLPGNQLEPLHCGEQAYPRMLAAIERAQNTVTLASYIFDGDEVGLQFVRVLAEAAKRNVRVHVLVDGIGALGSFSRMGRLLLNSGVQVAAFFPLRFPFGRLRINLRNHRKLLIVDGHTGFTGGMNISARHLVQRPEPGRSEDLHFQVTGPVVAEMQHVFVEDWLLATDQVLSGESYFPPLSTAGSAWCRGIVSGPDEDFEKIHWILLAALASAQQSIRITTPYFIPTNPLISAMALAALRGVTITLLLPSLVDHRYMRWAADAYLWQLLQRGVRIFRRPPPFVHTKLAIVDEQWTLLGSANLDRRSFRLNFEFNIEAYDPPLAATLAEWFDARAAESTAVTLEQVDSRPAWQRFRDGAAKLFSPYL